MKKLISAQTVKQAYKDGSRELEAPSKSIMYTPEALTVAKELGMRLKESQSAATGMPANPRASSKLNIDENLVRTVVEKVIDRLPPEKRQLDVIKNVVVEVLAEYDR